MESMQQHKSLTGDGHPEDPARPAGDEVLSIPGVVLVFMTAPWSAVCAAQEAELSTLTAGSFRVSRVDTGQAPDLARRLGVASVPTLLVLRDGMELERFTGMQPAEMLAGALGRALAEA